MAKRKKVGLHPDFEAYAEFIVAHPNYAGLYYDRDEDGGINWVVTGKSAKGLRRKKWWDDKCLEFGIPIKTGCYARVARLIHPTGLHVCQCCGEARSIFYEYPSKRTAALLNKLLGTDIDADSDEERAEYTIREIIETWCDSPCKQWAVAREFNLDIPESKAHLIEMIYSGLVENESPLFSPGVMSNSPDRFDGFHSYGLCCRTSNDTGRHTENMQTYTQDRRAYEDWSDGNYNLANRLMGEYRKQPPMCCPVCGRIAKMTADHIGPVSLGFCHSRHFAPMCKKCNSSKNNRFTKSDVDALLRIESRDEQVVSWHSEHIWGLLKNTVKDDADAKFVSSVMAKCHQNVLNILSLVYKYCDGKDFLMRYLHPEYSMIDYRFDNVDLLNPQNIRITAVPLDSQNKRKNRERCIRIAFESLDEFSTKKNRKNYLLHDTDSPDLIPLADAIKSGDYDVADKILRALIDRTAELILAIERAERADG